MNVFIIVEREVPEFSTNCALPDTSMTFSAFVLLTCLVTKSMLANAIFFHFQNGYHDFQDGRQNDPNLTNKSKSLTKACVFLIKMSPYTFLMYHTERRLNSCLSYSDVEKHTVSKMADKTIKFGILMYV